MATAASQARKLGLKAGQRVAIVGAAPGWQLADPPDVELVDAADGPVDLIIAFVRSGAELGPRVEALAPLMRPAGALWIAWPRRAAGHNSDVTDNAVRAVVLPLGLVDVKVAAIDPDWSALKVVRRVENR